MQGFPKLALAAAFACVLATPTAFAHAFLEQAIPGVGTTVNASPSELVLSFTQNIVLAFSGVQIAAADGVLGPSGRPMLDPAHPNVLHAPLIHPLKPGTYVVSWHVVSVDTHPSKGTYQFTIAP
jgi:methionine-rich copper-binding protein CopC